MILLASASAYADPAPSVPAEGAPERFFYHGYDYGSEATFNPGTVLLNRGFDVMQLRPAGRGLFRQTYGRDAANVLRNVASPFKAIAQDGWGKFARQELLPLSFTPTTARWVPNYGLHLLGGGVTYSMLREWYAEQHVPLPAAFSIATLYGAAFINETLENAGVDGVNTDALADLYVFDLAGMLLFSIPAVNTFFSKYVIVADWSLQPALAVTTGDLHNVGNYYSVKIPIPFYERLRLFGYVGFSSLAGLSYKLTPQISISAAAGSRVANFENASTTQVENVVKLKPSAAVFVDRNNSLLASLQVSDVQDYFVHLNVYPGALTQGRLGSTSADVFPLLNRLGFFTVIARDGHWATGISLSGLPLGAAVTTF
jgi:hypothetical protein